MLLAWIGQTDLDCAAGPRQGTGPIASVVAARTFDGLVLLSNYAAERNRLFTDWLAKSGAPPVHLRPETLNEPTDYGAIHGAAVRALEFARDTFGAGAVERTLTEVDGNKTRAAELVGLPSYQTFTNWMNRYEVKVPVGNRRR